MCFPEKGCLISPKALNQVKKVYFWGGNGRAFTWIFVHFRRKMLYKFTSHPCHCHPKNELLSPSTYYFFVCTYYYSARTKYYFARINYFLVATTYNEIGTHMQWIYYMHVPCKTELSGKFVVSL